MNSYPWFWELRGDGEFLPPEISSIGEGWQEWEGPLADGPSREGEIFVRELVQNFVDAAREQQAERPSVDLTPSLRFNFVHLTGKRSQDLAKKLNLGSHAERFKNLAADDKAVLRIGDSAVLRGDFTSLRLLIVRESFTTGMYGPWEMDDRAVDADGKRIVRKMRSALLATVGDKTSQGLGAYGEGKRAVIASSVPRIMLVYTCFEPRALTGTVTRRFLGATYWRPHTEGDKVATGLALLGQLHRTTERGMVNRPKPLDDDEADNLIQDLSIPFLEKRTASNFGHLGTTQVFIEPAFGPGDVTRALERNWWPLIEDGGAHFEVVDESGSRFEIAPDLRKELSPFLEAYRTARGTNPPRGNRDSVREVTFHGLPVNRAGVLSLTADVGEGGWSWKDRETNRNLVALIRDGMLIEYEPFPRTRSATAPPFVRGVFVTDSTKYPEAEKRLRLVEPPLHNYWNERNPKLDADSIELARRIYDHIRAEVTEFRKRFREVPPPTEDEFEVFGRTFNEPDEFTVRDPDPNPGPGREPETVDPWVNHAVTSELVADSVSEGSVSARATRSLALKDEWPESEIGVHVTLGWEVMGDKHSWEEISELLKLSSAKVPLGFTQVSSGKWHGRLTKNPVFFEWESERYPDYWTVRPFAEVSKED